MESFLKWIEPSSAFQVVSAVSIVIVLIMVLRGKVSKIGKDGVVFSNGLEDQLTDFMKKSDENDDRIMRDVAEIKQDVLASKEDRKRLHDSVDILAQDTRTLRLESLKTQILLQETSFERKLYLYDEYKKRGGNGWMDIYIQDLKNDHKE